MPFQGRINLSSNFGYYSCNLLMDLMYQMLNVSYLTLEVLVEISSLLVMSCGSAYQVVLMCLRFGCGRRRSVLCLLVR